MSANNSFLGTKNYPLTTEISYVRPVFDCKFNSRVNICEQTTETENTSSFW